jgi:tetratricopeptide (TPR) repeat protein
VNRFVEAIKTSPGASVFRVVDSDSSDPAEWCLEPMACEVLSEDDGEDFYIVRAFHIRPGRRLTTAWMDVSLPERINDYVYFVRRTGLEVARQHKVAGEVIPAVAIDCYGLYKLFHSKLKPEAGIKVLKKGLAYAAREGLRKRFIAGDLGYILRDEGRHSESIAMFHTVLEEEPSPVFEFGELAYAYRQIGNLKEAEKYDSLFRAAVKKHKLKFPRLT